MAAKIGSKIAQPRLYFLKQKEPFGPGTPGERLPEAYRKFWMERFKQKPEPVHYIPEPGKWKRNPTTGEVTPVQNVPIRVKYPKESLQQLWGGEGVVRGFQKRDRLRRRVPHFWVPALSRTVVYSEILDKHMSVVVTQRTIELIFKNYGFDHYILKTPACDLKSDLAMKMKRKLLHTLDQKDLYPDDPEKREEVYNNYKDYLKSYSKEELEWYGLTYYEAVKKLKQQERDAHQPVPLKLQYRAELVEKLLERKAEGKALPSPEGQVEETTSWLSRLNPFSGKSQDTSPKT